MVKLAEKFGANIKALREKHVPQSAVRFQFTGSRKRTSTILENVENGTDYGKRIHMQGAAEIVLRRCNRYINERGELVDMDRNWAAHIE